MIFIDTSALFALADVRDEFHSAAKASIEKVQISNDILLVHNYIIVETAALIQRRLSSKSSNAFLSNCFRFNIQWIDETVHKSAMVYLDSNDKSKLSFVDAVSFIVMQNTGITHYIGFDQHFEDAGFIKYL